MKSRNEQASDVQRAWNTRHPHPHPHSDPPRQKTLEGVPLYLSGISSKLLPEGKRGRILGVRAADLDYILPLL